MGGVCVILTARLIFSPSTKGWSANTERSNENAAIPCGV